MSERALRFGPEGALSGILTEPVKGKEQAGAPAVLMWNVGLNHHVGPWRFNVELSRALATEGVASFRFDMSGLGDSDPRRDTRSDHERALSDLREAMDLLTKRGIADSFVVVGFCSSVDAAHIVGCQEARVTGVVYLEGYTYRAPGFWKHYPLRLLDRHRVKRFLKMAMPRVFGSELTAVTGRKGRPAVFARDYPSTKQLRHDFASMVAMQKKLLFIYVGGDTNYNYHDQFFEMYGEGLRAGIDLRYYAGMDHTFFRVEHRRRVLTRVTRWICSTTLPVATTPPPSVAPRFSAIR